MLTGKMLLMASFILVNTVVFAQSKMQLAKMKQQLMTELKINDVKADSAVIIVQDFYKNAHDIKGKSELKDDERKTALQTNRKAEMIRLHAAGFSNEELQKLKQIIEEMKEERQHRKTGIDSTKA